MKKTTLLAIAILSSVMVNGQQSATFTNVALQNTNGRQVLHFSVPTEKNVRHYRIEACDDAATFETVTTLPAKNNFMLPTEYAVDVTAYHHACYRIAKVEMGGQMPYSAVVRTEQPQNAPKQRPLSGDDHIVSAAQPR